VKLRSSRRCCVGLLDWSEPPTYFHVLDRSVGRLWRVASRLLQRPHLPTRLSRNIASFDPLGFGLRLELSYGLGPLLGIVRLFDGDPLRRRTGAGSACWARHGRVNPWRIRISAAKTWTQPGVRHRQQSPVLRDIPVLSHLKLDTKWLGKAECALAHIEMDATLGGDVPIDRDSRREGAKACCQCARYLRQRCSVVSSEDPRVCAQAARAFTLAARWTCSE